MKLNLIGLLVAVATVLSACSVQQKQTEQHHRFQQHLDAQGPISIEALQSGYPVFNIKRQYQPMAISIQKFNAIKEPTHIKAFLGTWCHDSQREIPDLITFIQSLDNPNVTLSLIALNREKKDEAGSAEKAGIQYTPTIILYQNDQELGRVIEKSEGAIDQELTQMLPSAQ